jgi:hypothetical protein
VCAAIPFFGPINIQCRLRDGWPSVFEINPRFSGGIPLTIAAGANFPKMLIRIAQGALIPSQVGEFREGVWMTSYEASVFLEEANLRLPVCLGDDRLRSRDARVTESLAEASAETDARGVKAAAVTPPIGEIASTFALGATVDK